MQKISSELELELPNPFPTIIAITIRATIQVMYEVIRLILRVIELISSPVWSEEDTNIASRHCYCVLFICWDFCILVGFYGLSAIVGY